MFITSSWSSRRSKPGQASHFETLRVRSLAPPISLIQPGLQASGTSPEPLFDQGVHLTNQPHSGLLSLLVIGGGARSFDCGIQAANLTRNPHRGVQGVLPGDLTWTAYPNLRPRLTMPGIFNILSPLFLVNFCRFPRGLTRNEM